jgi:hypothetical protein
MRILPGITTSWTRYSIQRNGYSAENYHKGIHLKNVFFRWELTDKGQGILRRNGFCQELQDHIQGIHPRKWISLGITAHLRCFRLVRSKCAENPLNNNNSMISSSRSFIISFDYPFKLSDAILYELTWQ